MFKNEGVTRIQKISTPKPEQFDDGPYAALMEMVPEAAKKQLAEYRDRILRGEDMETAYEYLALAVSSMADDIRITEPWMAIRLDNWQMDNHQKFTLESTSTSLLEESMLSLYAMNQLRFGKTMLYLGDQTKEASNEKLREFEKRGRYGMYAAAAIVRKLADPTWDNFSPTILDAIVSQFQKQRLQEGIIPPVFVCAVKLFRPAAFPKDISDDDWRTYAGPYLLSNHLLGSAGTTLYAYMCIAAAEGATIDERGLHITTGKKRGMATEVREKPISRSI